MTDVENALRQIATHRCRRDSSLKLNPRHCRERIRRAMAPTPISTMLDFRTSVFLHCKGCPGPVPFAGEDSSPPDPIRLVSEATARKEGRVEEAPQRRLCSRNGKGCPVDGPQPLENFPGDRKTKSGHKSYCKTCQTIYQKARRARQRSKKAGRSEEPSRQEAAPTGAIVESPINAKDEAVQLIAALLYGYFGPASFQVLPRREAVQARVERFLDLPPFFQDRPLEVAADIIEHLNMKTRGGEEI